MVANHAWLRTRDIVAESGGSLAGAERLAPLAAEQGGLESLWWLFVGIIFLYGLALGYLGYRLHIKRLQVRGATLGLVATWALIAVTAGVDTLLGNRLLTLVLSIVGAAVGAALMVAFHRVYYSLFMGVSGSVVVGLLLGVPVLPPSPWLVPLALVCTAVAWYVYAPAIIVTTAAYGGVMVGLGTVLASGPTGLDGPLLDPLPTTAVLTGGFVFVTGTVTQLVALSETDWFGDPGGRRPSERAEDSTSSEGGTRGDRLDFGRRCGGSRESGSEDSKRRGRSR